MKTKFTTVLTGLLLLLGWMSASAQWLPNAPMRGSDPNRTMKSLTTAEAEALTYRWWSSEKNDYVESKSTDVARDPEQIYQLLKFVYTDPRFPGPYTCAYKYGGNEEDREDPVYYGGVDEGWEIPYAAGSGQYQITGDIHIGFSRTYISGSQVSTIYFQEIVVRDSATNAVITSWNANTNGANFPTGWKGMGTLYWGSSNNLTWTRAGSNGNYYYYNSTGAGTITIPASVLGNHRVVRVEVKAYSTLADTDPATNTLNVDGIPFDMAGTSATNPKTCVNTINRRVWVHSGARRPTDVMITVNTSVSLKSIVITGASGNTIINWNANSNLPSDWFVNGTVTRSGGYAKFSDAYQGTSTIRIPAEKFQGQSGITVSVVAKSGQLVLINRYRPINLSSNDQTVTQTVQFPPVEDYATYRPDDEGYTAIVVALKDDNKRLPWANIPYDRANGFTQKVDVLKYIEDNIQFVRLLPDGVRVGSGESIGTVFNCDGTYNKFFFLSKGRARKKDSGVLAAIGTGDPLWPTWMDEQVPFEYMYEQFSPAATSDQLANITDFYTEMMDGQLYSIVHDCPSVIQNGHEFSMSGRDNNTSYGMTGLNFYIPDYRLKYFTLYNDNNLGFLQDGRDMNAYMVGAETDVTGVANRASDHIGVNYARYHEDLHQPKVGIYRVTLDAETQPVDDYDVDNNPYYSVTLDWTSSLNEMSGEVYPQEYKIYEVVVDSLGNETKVYLGTVTTETSCTLDTTYLQGDYSQTHTYIIEGTITVDGRPAFFAWSNEDQVIIPGKSQFMSMRLDHYESDFIINGASDLDDYNSRSNNAIGPYNHSDIKTISPEHNYYRNFMVMSSLSDECKYHIDSINLKNMYTFNLYRSTLIPGPEHDSIKIATLEFEHPVAQDAAQVHFNINYEDNTQFILANKYRRSEMGIPEEGYLRIRGNGDVVIQPSGYEVNFQSITVSVGGTVVASWTASDGDVTSKGWYRSPGTIWVQHGTEAYYLEGGGYIAIPNILNRYTDVTVTIRCYGDASTTSKLIVDDRAPVILGNNTPRDYIWEIPNTAPNPAPRRAPGQFYQKITSLDELTDGEYLIVCEEYSRAFNGELSTQSAFDTSPNTLDLSFSGEGKIPWTQGLGRMSFTITRTNSGTYNIKSYSGLYIGRTDGSAGLNANTATQYQNTITFDGNGNAVIRGWSTGGLFSYPAEVNAWLRYRGTGGYDYFRYYNSQTSYSNIQLYKLVDASVEPYDELKGMIRLTGLPFVDQFKAETKENKHPYRYGYVLKYEPANGKVLKSARVEVPVQHTDSKVNGYFTLDSIDNDTTAAILVNMLRADVETTLSGTNSAVFYNTIQGRTTNQPVIFDHYRSVMQQQTNFTYKEMWSTSDRLDSILNPGLNHFYDHRKLSSTGTYETGTYGVSKRHYLPSIMTRGIDRHYYVDDTLHNTYGAPLWRTGVGQVDLRYADAVRQQNNLGTVTWKDENNNQCSLYFVDKFEAVGNLPHTDVSNVPYEPYMFRIFVKSNNGKLRAFTKVDANPATQTTEHLEAAVGDTVTHGPICVWSGYVNDVMNANNADEFITTTENSSGQTDYSYHKNVGAKGRNAMFGALDNLEKEYVDGRERIKPDELEILVRFYYIREGLAQGHLHPAAGSPMLRSNGGAEYPAGYATEDSYSPSPQTYVSETQYIGEIVEIRYYNPQGLQSDKPFEGVNIVVMRFSDGTTTATKVVR